MKFHQIVFFTFIHLRSLYVIHPRPSPMLLPLLCFSRYFYHFSCPGLLQLSVWVFLSVLLSLPPATSQIQIGQRQIWHFFVRKKNHLKWRSSWIFSCFLSKLHDLINNSLALVKKTDGNFHYFSHIARNFIKQQSICRIINDYLESSYVAYFFAPYDMAVIFLTFAGCFFFSLPGIQKLVNNS